MRGREGEGEGREGRKRGRDGGEGGRREGGDLCVYFKVCLAILYQSLPTNHVEVSYHGDAGE